MGIIGFTEVVKIKRSLKPYNDLSYSGKRNRLNPEYMKKLRREWKRTARLSVLNHYSNGTMVCADCGEDNINFLTVDHVEGGGRKHRKEIRTYLTLWLWGQYRKTGKWPGDFQVICSNCNDIKKFEENGFQINRGGSTAKLINEIRHLLGDKCAVCSFADARALHIHNRNGGDTKKRNRLGYYPFYKSVEAKILDGSKEYQLLCANHNLEKELKLRAAAVNEVRIGRGLKVKKPFGALIGKFEDENE